MLIKPKQAKKVLKAAGEVEVSDKIRENLTDIVAVMVHDWSPPLRNAVAEDPRIQKRFTRSKCQIEKAVLRDCKWELSKKRKDKLNLSRALAELALSLCCPRCVLPFGPSCANRAYATSICCSQTRICAGLGGRS